MERVTPMLRLGVSRVTLLTGQGYRRLQDGDGQVAVGDERGPGGPGEGYEPRDRAAGKTKERDRKRPARIGKAAEQGGLLTVAELSVILDKSYEIVRGYVREWEEETAGGCR